MTERSDLDFDELDKAVTSLMGKVGSETLDESGKTKTLDISETLQPDDKPKFAAIDHLAETIGNETLVTEGEVELTADLDASTNAAPIFVPPMPSPVASSDSASVEASADTVAASATSEVAAPPPPVDTPPPAPQAPVVPRPNSGRFMDVVHPASDMRTASSPSSAATTLSVPSQQTVATTPAASSQPQKSMDISRHFTDAPIASPFLPDAKVEKRPLGTQAGDAPVSPVEPPSSSETGTPEAKPSHDVVDGQLELNPEQVETASSNAHQEIQQIEAADATATSVAPESQASIYDTTQYHQGVSHPKKQKSGWGIVVIIIVIILLAVAAAAGAYFFLGLQG